MNHLKISPCAGGLKFTKRFKHWRSIENQYWQKSKIPTMHFQPSLPRLPIPKLEQTCKRYLAAQRPLLSDEVYKKTEAVLSEFRETTGKEFQELLLANDNKNKHTSYICEPWFDMYLKDRKPLPINYNPVLVFLNDKRQEYNDQSIKTANMIISSLRFYKSLQNGLLEPEVFHLNPKKSDTSLFRSLCAKIPSAISWYAAYMFNAYPLDMSQYHNLFNSTRIPEIGKDRIYTKPKTKHVVAQCNGHFYAFDVLDANGYILRPEKILGNIKSILNNSVPKCDFPLGVLTTLERDTWASLRQHFSKIGNEQFLETVDSALFNICLDDCTIGTDPIVLCQNFIHGDGTNRWFDKSISLIVTRDGVAGVNFEHSWGDGVAVLRYFQDIHKDSVNNPFVHPNTEVQHEANSVHKLEPILDDKMKDAVSRAAKEYKSTCDSLDMNVVELDGVGKNLCKQHRLGPDAIMQLSFQVAYHKMNGKHVSTYESCSTAAFKHGRTETIRPCTAATKAFSEAINSTQPPSNTELYQMLAECSKVHSRLTREAAMGQGFDRHLFALKLLANASNKSPAIFEDPAYTAINHNILSTSTLSSPHVWAGGFGPVVKDGLGVAYTIRDDYLGVLATSYPPHGNGKDFIQALRKSYNELVDIMKKKK